MSEETKTCRDCGETKPLSEYYARPPGYIGPPAYCKPCHRKRSSASVMRRRAERIARGLPANVPPPEPDEDAYIRHHERLRARESAIQESLLREKQEQQFSDRGMSLDLNDHPPVFRDLTNYFQRPQTKVSSWKTV